VIGNLCLVEFPLVCSTQRQFLALWLVTFSQQTDIPEVNLLLRVAERVLEQLGADLCVKDFKVLYTTVNIGLS
jgi:hypothetical protein